jgi:hypothetical protein
MVVFEHSGYYIVKDGEGRKTSLFGTVGKVLGMPSLDVKRITPLASRYHA